MSIFKYVFKIMKIFALLKGFPVVIKISIFQKRTKII